MEGGRGGVAPNPTPRTADRGKLLVVDTPGAQAPTGAEIEHALVRSRMEQQQHESMRSGYVPAVMRDHAPVTRGSDADDELDDATPAQQQEILRKRSERQYLRSVFKRIDFKCDGMLDDEEVGAYLHMIGYAASPSEVQKLMWEVDDDGDGVISWKEFEQTHLRLVHYDFRNTRLAFEPRGFFNLNEFSVLDKDGNGTVDASEVIAVFYRRYGKDGAMQKVHALVEQGALDKTICFTDFITHDNKLRSHARKLYAETAGYAGYASVSGGVGGHEKKKKTRGSAGVEMFADRGTTRGRAKGVDEEGRTIRGRTVELGRVKGRPQARKIEAPSRHICLTRPI
jgi:Ca2+-binding EF-hand superfamily protein